MARFPRSEPEILGLAQELVIGLSNNVAVYPSPPISVMDMATTISSYATAKNTAVAAQATAEQATSDKEEALDDFRGESQVYCTETIYPSAPGITKNRIACNHKACVDLGAGVICPRYGCPLVL